MAAFIDEFSLGDIPHVADVDGSFWQRFGVISQPSWAFVDRDGAVTVQFGALTRDELTSIVEALAA